MNHPHERCNTIPLLESTFGSRLADSSSTPSPEGHRPSKPRRRRGSSGGRSTPRPDADTSSPHDIPDDDTPQERLRPPPVDPAKVAEIFDTSIRFADLGLRPDVLRGVEEAGFVYPTKIQAQLIPPLLAGQDLLGQAKTGTGKTAAFALPILNACEPGVPMQTLILVPTRELAIQVAADFAELGRYSNIRSLPVYGGQKVSVQASRLHQGPEILIATPGRLMDLAERRMIHYGNIRRVVLDEVDRMLDIGFRDDIRRILSACPTSRQTVFVSATISEEVERLARKFCKPDCQKIVTTAGALTVELVRQFHLTVQPWEKRRLLLHLLTHEEPDLTLVFCRMKRTVDDISLFLQKKGIEAHAIHGDMRQNLRDHVMRKLRKGNLSVLIASDLASRGLDVEGITHVINYDLPDDPDLYVHRIGRTARAGRDGIAWSFVTPEQGALLTQIELLINAEIPKLEYPDFTPGPVPADVIASKELDAKRANLAKSFNRFAAPAQRTTPAVIDQNKFPGGIVPSKMPPKRLHGTVKTTRSLKESIQQTFMPPASPEPKDR